MVERIRSNIYLKVKILRLKGIKNEKMGYSV